MAERPQESVSQSPSPKESLGEVDAGDFHFRRAMAFYYQARFREALAAFRPVAHLYRERGDWTQYLECLSYLLRMHVERMEWAELEKVEREILELVADPRLGIQARAKAYHVLGFSWYGRRDQNYSKAETYFREASRLALEAKDHRQLAHALHGLGAVCFSTGRIDEAKAHLSNLSSLLEQIDANDLKISRLLFYSFIARHEKRLDEALRLTWEVFELLKREPNLTLYIQTFVHLGRLQLALGHRDLAQVYLEIAKQTVSADELPRLSTIVDEALAQCREPNPQDLIFDRSRGTISSRGTSLADVSGQIVLKDLMSMFLGNPGRVFSKEDICQHVWGEAYDPSVHDNKIYVTIKRLRRLIDPSGKGKFILRAKGGYFFNPKANARMV